MKREELLSLLDELYREEERRGPVSRGGLGDYNADAPTIYMIVKTLRKLVQHTLDKKEQRKRK